MANYIAPNATIVGNVSLGDQVSVWYGAVLRGDNCTITVGENTNIQDNAVIHSNTVVGKGVTIGHSAIIHGCTIGDNCMIGMGAIVLNNAVIGNNCIVGAGAVVTGKMNAPDGSMILGNPARIVKELTPEQIAAISANAELYISLAQSGLPCV